MSSAAPSSQPLQFAGEARCERDAAQLRISGTELGSALPLCLVFAGCAATDLPQSLRELRIAGAAGRWQLDAGQGRYVLEARALQVVRDVSVATARALPGVAPSWSGRVGWALLLNLLRIPGVAGALKRLRGA